MENIEGGSERQRGLLSMPKFSVLMSVYKNEKPEYLIKAIDSVLEQTLLPNEILIVKDGLLTDELEKVLDEYKQKSTLFRYLEFKENRGLGLALRDGVLACNYGLIARMDTDDICKPERFEKQIKYLKEHPDVALLGTFIEEFSQDENKPDTITKLPCEHEEIKTFAKKRNPFRHMTIMFNKAAVLDSGNYRNFLWFEDYDLWVRMIGRGFKTANISEILVSVRADKDMFARRGGRKYLKQEIEFQRFLLSNKFIGMLDFVKNIVVRSIVRMMPNELRILIYRKMLRR